MLKKLVNLISTMDTINKKRNIIKKSVVGILFIIFIVLIVVCGVFSVVKMGVNVGDRTLPEFILDNFVYVVTIIGNIMATIYLVIVPKNNGIETERSIVKS